VPADLSGQTMVVTGASPGSIGFETARILAAWGASVAVTTRTNTDATVADLAARAGRGTSKLALVHASFEIQRRHANEHVQGYCLHPARCSRTSPTAGSRAAG
jgi:NADP-dependent 3-hydroxy acid dehydrogenase YdfG